METGNLNSQKNRVGRHQSVLIVDQEEEIIEIVEAEPSTRLRTVVSQTYIKKDTIHRFLRRNGLYAFMSQKVQVLHDGDTDI